MKQEIRIAKEKYYKDNISGNRNKDSAKWWRKINKLTEKDKSTNFSLTDPESQSVMNAKGTANYINSFFVGLTKDFPVVQGTWLVNDETESLPTVSRESGASRLRELKTNTTPGLNDPDVKILKKFADFFAIPLADIFNELLIQSVSLSFGMILWCHLYQKQYLVQVLTNYVLLHLLVLYQSFKSPTF